MAPDWKRVTLDSITVPGGIDPADLIAFNELMDQLAEHDAQTAEVAKLRIFVGLTIAEIAGILNIGSRTVDRQWAFAHAWLRTHLSSE